MLRPFTVHQPTSLEEAIALRTSLGDDVMPYAGGTELILAMKLGLAHWPHLLDVKRIPNLDRIEVDDMVRIGATATHRAIARDQNVFERLPALARLESNVANVRVRAAGTLGGNLAFAEPHADPPALLIALCARVVLAGPDGERRVELGDFLTGAYETSLGPAELLLAIEIPMPPPGVGAAYMNFKVLERPSIGVAVVGSVEDGRFKGAPTIVIGAVDEVPRRVVASGLDGARHDDRDAVEGVAAAARREVDPIDDLAGTAGYKRHLTGVLVRRVLAALAGGATRTLSGVSP
jgi:carbon-monoxide dehydrogenase medium subunit